MFQKYLAYRASAGSGKTFALSVRYIALLFMGVSPSNILAVTFTNKAVNEMLSRIATSLIELDNPKNEHFLNEISKQTSMTTLQLLEAREEVLKNFLSSRNFISTLDGFFTSIVKSSGIKIGLSDNFSIKTKDNELLKEPFLLELHRDNLLDVLLELAIEIEDKRFDKLFNLLEYLYRIYPLLPKLPTIEINISIEQIESKREELYKALQLAKVSNTALRNFEPMSVMELTQREIFAKTSLTENRNYKKYVEKNPQLDELFLELKEIISSWILLKESVILEKLLDIFSHFKNSNLKKSKEENSLGFDDITALGYEIIKLVSKEYLKFKIDTTFEHILIDEFQDTATLQYLLLQPFIDEIFEDKEDKFKSFFYVGDTKQSLYRFRGGVEELFDVMAKRYNITISQMDTSYRSSQNVVGEVNRWFKTSMQGYQPQIAHRKTLGFVEVIETEDIISSTVDKIEWLIKNGAVQNDITILVVTNKDGLALQDACFEQHINAILKSSSSIKTLPKIASLVAMVRYLKEAQQIDAYNFALSCGVESFNIEWFNPFMSSFEVLHQLIKEFNYFEGDKNILKLLEFSLDLNDIDEFLKEFETSNIAIAQNSIHGVNIMTIHGSKGLEFEHVIVMDKLGKSNADRSPFIFEHDENLFIKNIFYRMKNRDSFDKFYKKAIEDKHLLSQKDTLNLLYVALTRASDNMIVVKKDEDSLFDILGMTPSICGELKIKSSHQEDFSNNEEIKQFKFQDYGKRKQHKTLKKSSPEISFGNALHHALEMLNNFDIKNLDKVLTLSTQIYQDEVGLKDLEDIKNRVKMLCENELFIQLLKDKKSIKELPITINNEAKQIDLILQSEDEIFVIDYKSSLKFQNKHKEQVTHYVKAIETIMQKPTKGFLIYLLGDRVEMVLV